MTGKSRKEKGHEAKGVPHGSGKANEDSEGGKWDVVVLEVAKKEGRKILTELQYDHIVDVLKRLVDFGNAEEIGDIDIEPIESFYELKEKGGVLGRINLRVYFGTIPEARELVVAKAYKKEEDGPTPRHVIILVEHRLDEYKAGGRQKGVARHRATVSKR